jgi:hypothetical protein
MYNIYTYTYIYIYTHTYSEEEQSLSEGITGGRRGEENVRELKLLK